MNPKSDNLILKAALILSGWRLGEAAQKAGMKAYELSRVIAGAPVTARQAAALEGLCTYAKRQLKVKNLGLRVKGDSDGSGS